MKSLDQFTALTDAEVLNTNGGGLLDNLTGLLGGALGNTINDTTYVLAVGAATSATLLAAGASSALTSIGAGLGVFFSKLGLPTV